MPPKPIHLRDARRDDAALLQRLFLASVHGLAASAYTPAQLEAWASRAPEDADRMNWSLRIARQRLRIAEIDGGDAEKAHRVAAGFISFEPPDTVDLLYVHPAHARRGIASALYADLENHAHFPGVASLQVYASALARPFFEARGYAVLRAKPCNGMAPSCTTGSWRKRCVGYEKLAQRKSACTGWDRAQRSLACGCD